jgi:hypothetical protein
MMVHSDPSNSALTVISDAIDRLDRRRHVSPATLEVSRQAGDGMWRAIIMADPLPLPPGGLGQTPERALAALADSIRALDWRTVKR